MNRLGGSNPFILQDTGLFYVLSFVCTFMAPTIRPGSSLLLSVNSWLL